MKPVAVWINLVLGLTSILPVFPQENELIVELPGEEIMEFVWIEPGTFMMGTTEEQKAHMDSLTVLGKSDCTGSQGGLRKRELWYRLNGHIKRKRRNSQAWT